MAATNTDDVESYSIGRRAGAVYRSRGPVNIVNATTTATIADSALVNDNMGTANPGQQVVVVASNDFRHAAAAGVAGPPRGGGAGVDVTVTDNTTTAPSPRHGQRDDVHVSAGQ